MTLLSRFYRCRRVYTLFPTSRRIDRMGLENPGILDYSSVSTAILEVY